MKGAVGRGFGAGHRGFCGVFFCVSLVEFRIKRSAWSFCTQTLSVWSGSASPAGEPWPHVVWKKEQHLKGWRFERELSSLFWESGKGLFAGFIEAWQMCLSPTKPPSSGSNAGPVSGSERGWAQGRAGFWALCSASHSMPGSWNGPLAIRENCLCSFQQMEQIFYKAILHRKNICVRR